MTEFVYGLLAGLGIGGAIGFAACAWLVSGKAEGR